MASPMRVVPNPIVMACTVSKLSATAAMATRMPDTTGSKPMATLRQDRYTPNNRAKTLRPPINDRRSISDRMVLRACTANTGVPDMRSCSVPSVFRASKLLRMTVSARSCASVSVPLARVMVTSSARCPSADAHAPSVLEGALPPATLSSVAHNSPVGSRGRSDLSNRPADPDNSTSVWLMASCSPWLLKRSALTLGLST